MNKHESTQHEDALKQETAWGFTRCLMIFILFLILDRYFSWESSFEKKNLELKFTLPENVSTQLNLENGF